MRPSRIIGECERVNVAVIIVGINQWEEYTLPLVRSIEKHEPDVDIFVVDNYSDPSYIGNDCYLVRTHERVCYSAAINAGYVGMELALRDPDWTIILNNDVKCLGPFVDTLEWMHRGTLYGNQFITFKDLRWLGLWLFVISREVREAVGKFDEKFNVCGFDDADYCFRAAAAGFEIRKSNLPFQHYWGKTRWDIPNYKDTRQENLKYLEEKHGVSLAGEWEVFN